MRQDSAAKKIWYQVHFEKKQRALVKRLYPRFGAAPRAQLLRLCRPPKDKPLVSAYESKQEFSYTHTQKQVFASLCADVYKAGVFSVLTHHEGYGHYVLLENWYLNQLSTYLSTMFWLGSIVRYRPLEAQHLMDSHLGSSISEFLSINPNQFAYHLANILTATECVRPFTML